MNGAGDLRRRLGALALDGPRALRDLLLPGRWPRLRNRGDRLTLDPEGRGARCEGEYSRSLHFCDVFPRAGNWLLRRALAEWPVASEPSQLAAPETPPATVSFIIGHRGEERLPQLLFTLQTLRNQRNVAAECVVVEQDEKPRVQAFLPSWVRHVWAPRAAGETPYCRAAAFNDGARVARGEALVLHDGDLPAPRDYAAEILRKMRQGCEVCRLARFIFYLDRDSTESLIRRRIPIAAAAVERVIQNAVGGSTAIARTAYEEIGGMDEEFVGWGGEDNEFWQRCLTRRVWDFGYLPLLHLWHPSRADRTANNPAMALWMKKREQPVAERIRRLRSTVRTAAAAAPQRPQAQP